MRSKRTKALEISPAVKRHVYERDNGCCVLCGSPNGLPNAHYIGRAQGGLGVEKNIVTLCPACHREYDQSAERKGIRAELREYLQSCYPEWDENDLIYRKYGGT